MDLFLAIPFLSTGLRSNLEAFHRGTLLTTVLSMHLDGQAATHQSNFSFSSSTSLVFLPEKPNKVKKKTNQSLRKKLLSLKSELLFQTCVYLQWCQVRADAFISTLAVEAHTCQSLLDSPIRCTTTTCIICICIKQPNINKQEQT